MSLLLLINGGRPCEPGEESLGIKPSEDRRRVKHALMESDPGRPPLNGGGVRRGLVTLGRDKRSLRLPERGFLKCHRPYAKFMPNYNPNPSHDREQR